MGQAIKVLILEDAATDAELIERELRRGGLKATCLNVATKTAYEKALIDFIPDLVLSDYKLPSFTGADALLMARAKNPDLPFILVTGALGDEMAADIMKKGANDYLLKERLAHLPELVNRVLEESANKVRLKASETSLKEAMEFYTNIVNYSPYAIAIHREGRVEFINPAGLRLIGAKTPEEVIGKQIVTIVHPDYHKLVAERLKKVMETGKPAGLAEEIYLRLDGAQIDVEATTSLLTYKGKPAFQTIITDITERKKMTRALQESEEKFRVIAEKNPTMLFINRQGKVVYVNAKCSEILGYSREEFLAPSFDFISLIHPDDRQRIYKIYASHLQGSETKPYEYRLLTKNGTIIDAINSSSLIDLNGEKAILGIVTDITERKKIETQLAEHASTLEIINQIAVGLSTISPDVDIYKVIADHLKRLTGAVAATVSFYDEGKKALVVKNIFSELQIAEFFKETVGDNIIGINLPVNQQAYDLMLHDQGISQPMDLSAVTFGKIPKLVSDTFHKLFNISCFYGISFIMGGKLIATSSVAMPKDKTVINRELLEVFANIAAVAISRRLAENSLKESEEHYRNIVEISPDGIAIHCEGKIVFVNSAAQKILGAANPEQLIGQPVISVVHPDSQKTVGARIKQMLTDGTPVPFIEEKFIKLDGGPIEVETAASPTTFQGKPAVQVVVRDIGPRKQAERSLKNSEELFRRLFETTPTAYLLINKTGQVVRGNARVEELLGWSNEEIQGRTIKSLKLFPLLEMPRMRQLLAADELPDNNKEKVEFQLLRKNGECFFGSITVSMTTINNEELIMLGIEDISRQKELANLKDKFIMTVSHELRTPLTAIRSLISNLEDGVVGQLGQEQHEYIKLAGEEAERLAKLIDNVLAISRLESGKMTLHRKKVALCDLVKKAVIGVTPLARQRHISIKLNEPPQVPLLEVDPDAIDEVLVNVLGNAIKFNRENGEITVSCQPANKKLLEVTVADTGIGIATGLLEKVFDKFFQASQTVGEGGIKGSGLGLAICREIITMHGGKIWVTSKIGHGSTFHFTLPIAKEGK